MSLMLIDHLTIAPGLGTDFDHGDVDPATGRLFIAHTAAGTVEVVDPLGREQLATIPGCPEASGVLCAPARNLVFVAARAAGKVLIIDPATFAVQGEVAAGSRPNGLAWDDRRARLLVADVADNSVRLVDLAAQRVVATTALPGRPRWCMYDRDRDRFLVNVREPAAVAVLDAESLGLTALLPVSASGPHGMDIDQADARAFVACDGQRTIVFDLTTDREIGSVAIPGAPDATWFNPRRNLLYVAIGTPGVLSVIDAATMTVVEEIVTEPGAGTTAFDVQRQLLYVFLPRTSRVAIYAQR